MTALPERNLSAGAPPACFPARTTERFARRLRFSWASAWALIANKGGKIRNRRYEIAREGEREGGRACYLTGSESPRLRRNTNRRIVV